MWASAGLRDLLLCPFLRAFSLHELNTYVCCQAVDLYKVIIWTNGKLMSSTSPHRMEKLSSLTSFLVYVSYLCISFGSLLVLSGEKPMSAFAVSAEDHYP